MLTLNGMSASEVLVSEDFLEFYGTPECVRHSSTEHRK